MCIRDRSGEATCQIYAFVLHVGQSQSGRQVVSQQKLADLASEVDPKQVLDEDVEEVSQMTARQLDKHSC